MKKIILVIVGVLFYVLPSFARGGCAGHGGHCGGHCGSHGGHVYVGCHISSDTANKYMLGIGKTNDGQVFAGKFIQCNMLSACCIFYPSEYPTCHGAFRINSFQKFVFAGADTTLSYRKDSTEYCHVGNYKDMLRKLTSGKIEVYDETDLEPQYYGSVSNIVLKYYGLVINVGSVKKLDHMMRSIIPAYDETHPISKKNRVDVTSVFKAINDFNNKS